ncbi:transglycosylase domain-containing protein [Xanthomarina sp. F2636L]|uniref:transglycosylase domain-containing protein n=1 Tax=Xanthomarina sp. F2636L TaxID=2996018 RepID=UPI00225DD0DA|nr:transglycosylase domain-containing protein [Xanthomarina sp. F2636L]MCX7550607.1 transglycosylase domain-containing protein [Xanthomarina sp. F2636L]
MILKNQLFRKWTKRLAYSFIIIAILLLGLYGSIYYGLWGEVPSAKKLANLKQSQATQVLDSHEELIGKFYIYDRQSIAYKDFPQHLIDALIATEDTRFYEHNGIDNTSLLRVFFKTILLSDASSGGGSTITLQLAKNLYGRKDYGFLSIVVNKLKESIVARRIEDIYSKKEILTLYLNTVPFPDNTYGIESASQKFFNTKTRLLNLSQAATLIGSLKANTGYNPRLYPKRSQERRDLVISLLKNQGVISEKTARDATEKDMELDYQYYAPNQGLAPYFRAQVKKQLDSILQQKKYKNPDGEAYSLFHDGLKVYTTLDNTIQRYAEEAMQEHMSSLQRQFEKGYGQQAPWLKNKPIFLAAKKRLKTYRDLKNQGLTDQAIEDSLKKTKETKLFSWDEPTIEHISTLDSLEYYSKFLNAGFLSIEPTSGAIKAYVGGIDYRYFQYDHVSQSKRQVGSTFKPIVYTAALENGMKPCSYFSIKEVTYTDVDNWTPKNASKVEDEELNYSLEYALSRSVNTISVKILQDTGVDKVIAQAKAMGIESDIEKVPSIALGTSNLTLIELATAYTSYVNKSIPSKPIFITRIEDKNGNVIATYDDLNPKSSKVEKAYSDNSRQIILEFLKETVNNGTANRLRSTYNLKNEIAGKTGTTQDNKDGWFVGIIPNLVTVTWVGNDNQQIGFSNTRIGQGANSALPMFAKFLQKLNNDSTYKNITDASFETPSDQVKKSINCDYTKEDSFFNQLFGKDKTKERFKKKKKKGFFSWLKKDKDSV